MENGRGLTDRNINKPTQHFTAIFNTFVMMTLFNEFNSRKIHGQRNVFDGLQRNILFIIIWCTTFVGQVCCHWMNIWSDLTDYMLYFKVIIVQYGGYALHTTALELHHWLWCLLFGIGVLLWAQVGILLINYKLGYYNDDI